MTTRGETIVHSDDPGKILPVLERELEDFDTEATRFLNGEFDEMQFIGFRLKQGVYGQRQPGVQMIRVKLPLGQVTADQLDALGEVAERFTPLRKGHITTRENIQYHHVPLIKAMQALHVLGKVGLSTREACGNTVRNVTGDPWAGVNPDEPFDPTPYAAAFARYWLRNPLTQLLPRKFKVAFSSSDKDVAITGLHDLGFIPKIRDGEKGFQMLTGGGLSIMARVAYTLKEFVPMEDYLRVSEAVLRIFERSDELRKNRARARIKFLIDRVGIEEFQRMVDEELQGEWAKRDFRPGPLLYFDDEEADVPSRRPTYLQTNGDMREFSAFVASNVKAQRQQGFSTVEVKVSRGDVTPEQFAGLAAILRDYGNGRARTTAWQNIVLRWIRDESLYEVWKRLTAIGLGEPGAHGITDVLSCPGTDSCKLGITSSMGLNSAIQERIREMKVDDSLTASIHIKMSGCPNSCGQHHIANIGFHGAAIKVGDRQLPAYLVFVGGAYDQGTMRIATQLKLRVPAKRCPDLVERLLRFYERDRQDGEVFNDFFDRVGPRRFEEEVQDLTLPGELDEANRSMFIDWERITLYELQRGEGECAI